MDLADVVKYVPIWQAIVSSGLLFVAWRSLCWATATFAQRERHERAKEVPHTAFRLSFVPPDGLSILLDDDWARVIRWLTNFNGRGFLGIILPPQRISCYLLNMGPGVVASAEIPYTAKLYDVRPVDEALPPVERFEGTFRFFHVMPGVQSLAVNAFGTAFYPFVRVSLGQPTIRDVTGVLVVEPPDKELSSTVLDVENFSFWTFFATQQRQQAQSGLAVGIVNPTQQ